MRSDKAVLLLSSDWFKPFLREFGLVLDLREETAVQQCARTAVRELVGTAKDYWGADVSEMRRAQTEARLLDCLLGTGSRFARDQIEAFVGAPPASVETEETTLWLFDSITERVVTSGPTAGLNRKTLQLVTSAWRTASRDAPDEDGLEAAALASDTEWDNYLRRLTSGLPTYLSDYAALHLLWPSRFKRFWATLSWMLSADARAELIEWYVAEAKRVADESFEVSRPVWLR